MATTQLKANPVQFADGTTSTTTTQVSKAYTPWGALLSVQARVAGTGAVAASVAIQVSDNATNWITATTLSLSGTDVAFDGAAYHATWAYYRVSVSGITGTGATVTAWLGGQGA
jgi:hypothetical protein